MTALTAARRTTSRPAMIIALGVAASTTIYQGGMVALNASGYAVPASASPTLKVLGRAMANVDNAAGSNGALIVEAEAGCFRFENSEGGDAISSDDIGKPCYAVDDQTLALTSNGGARPIAGLVADVDADGVWVLLGVEARSAAEAQADGDTQATDVIAVHIASLAAAGPHYTVAGIAGTITKIYTIIDAELATGNAVLTTSINGTPIDDGAVTITQTGSAAGDLDESTPTANNVIAVGDKISIAKTGTNDAAVTGRMFLIVSR